LKKSLRREREMIGGAGRTEKEPGPSRKKAPQKGGKGLGGEPSAGKESGIGGEKNAPDYCFLVLAREKNGGCAVE